MNTPIFLAKYYNKLMNFSGLGNDEGGSNLTVEEERDLYQARPSILEYLKWSEYDVNNKLIRLDDGYSVASAHMVFPLNTEGFSEKFIYSIRSALRDALHTIPGESQNPWVLQFYVKDEPIRDLEQKMRSYVNPRAQGTKFTESYISHFVKHCNQLSEETGIFNEGGASWKGCHRVVRMVLYRLSDKKQAAKRDPVAEHKEVSERFIRTLKTREIATAPLNGADIYQWMFPWFNPKPSASNGDPYAYMKKRPYPTQEEKEGALPLAFDLASFCFVTEPEALDPSSCIIKLNGAYSEYISVAPVSTAPTMGILGLEPKSEGVEAASAALDRLPPGSTFAMTITVLDQDNVKATCNDLLDQLKGLQTGVSEAADQAQYQAKDYKVLKEHGAKAFHLNMGIYIQADTRPQLIQRRMDVEQTMLDAKLPIISPVDDITRQNSFLRQLPMGYNPAYAKSEHRAGLTFSHHVANLLPLYGRSTGTGNLGFMFWNRTGEVLSLDPFNKKDRTRAAHGLLLGPTGSGKSAISVYFVEHLTALLRPQWFIIEVGNSFGLLAEHCKANGLKVVHKKLSASANEGLSPFSDALEALAQFELLNTDFDAGLEDSINLSDDFIENVGVDRDDNGDDETRDILGEMETSLRLMITGGEDKEEARMQRPDRILMRQAILDAARRVKALSRLEVIVSDLILALEDYAKDDPVPRRRDRAEYMAESLQLFTQGVEAKFFNKPGKSWDETADVTIVDLDLFARQGNEDKLAVVMTGLLNRINGIAEATQHDGRPIIVWIDEAHVVTTNPLLAPYVATIGKMWRKLGCWLWLATQNMTDFPDVSSKMLSMAEFWICLVPPESEIESISRFMNLSEDQIQLLRECRKAPPNYIEGVVLSPKTTALFRNIPPSRSLALGQTEDHEKLARKIIMDEHGCSELEAAYRIADRIYEGRNQFKMAQRSAE
jgi:conjugative transfer ATPase